MTAIVCWKGLFLISARLLHDVGDHKYAKQDKDPENQIDELLMKYGASLEMAAKVQLIVENVSLSLIHI